MKRILINATHNEEIRVALCKDNHMYDFDLENRTREQKKANIYKAHVTRVEPSLEAVFVEYGSNRQGFLPIREIAKEYLSGKRGDNVRDLIKEGDTLIVQIEKEERGNKGAALSTFVSLAGRFLVLMPNNPRGGGISRQISGKMREEMKRIVANLEMPQGMSVIIRTAGINKTQEDLQHDLSHLLTIWNNIDEQNKKFQSPRLVHQEAGVVTRAVRDYLRDDISEIWIDNEEAYNEAAAFIAAVMPKQADKLRKYTDVEPMLARFGIEKQIETAYQREVRLPSGGSIVIDQTEAMVAIDINSAKSKKGADVSGTAYHTNLEAAEEIARQLRLRDMGGLVVIDFIDMYETDHQKEVEKRLVSATKYDRARVQFGHISKFGLMEMSRQRLRPSLEEATGFKCPRCHGNGMIRDLRSLGLSIMRQIEQTALSKRQGEIQAEVPTDIAAFLLNEKRDSIVYLEQDSGTRITILPHAHMESPEFKLHYNPEGFAPSSYERINDSEDLESNNRGYEINWQTAETERPKTQPTRQTRDKYSNPVELPDVNSTTKIQPANSVQNNAAPQAAQPVQNNSAPQAAKSVQNSTVPQPANAVQNNTAPQLANSVNNGNQNVANNAPNKQVDTKAIAWLSNLFAPTAQATLSDRVSGQDAAGAIEALINQGNRSLGAFGQVDNSVFSQPIVQATTAPVQNVSNPTAAPSSVNNETAVSTDESNTARKPKNEKVRYKKERRYNKNKSKPQVDNENKDSQQDTTSKTIESNADNVNNTTKSPVNNNVKSNSTKPANTEKESRKPNSKRDSRGEFPRTETLDASNTSQTNQKPETTSKTNNRPQRNSRRTTSANDVNVQVSNNQEKKESSNVIHVSLDDNKATKPVTKNINESHKPKQQRPIQEKANVKQAEKTVIAPEVKPSEVVTLAVSPETLPTSVATIDAIQTAISIDPQPKEARVATDEVKAIQTVATDVVETKSNHTDVADTKATTAEIAPMVQKTVAIAPTVTAKVTTETAEVNPRADGRAFNDPRVVLEELSLKNQSTSTADSSAATVVSTAVDNTSVKAKKITGTVGSFIREVLDDAADKIATEGVIKTFLFAVNKFNSTSIDTDNGSNAVAEIKGGTDNKTSTPDFSNFDFSNYGYEVLETDYLVQFSKMIRAINRFSTTQGKTEVKPLVVTQRVSNDPRGQADLVIKSAIEAENKTDSNEKLDTSENYVDSGSTALFTDTPVVEVLIAENKEVLVEAAMATNEKDTSGVVASDTTADITEVEVKAETSVVEVKAEEPQKNEEISSKDRPKTTFDKYKSMLANVSEQMLNNGNTTSMLLSSQPVPKMRTRKVKKDD